MALRRKYSLLVLFRKPAKAVECAISMQRAAHKYNQNKIDAENIFLKTIGDRP